MARRFGLGVVGWVCCLAASAYGQGQIYVNGVTGSDAWDGRCEVWDGDACGPKATIQAGIDAAVAGDEVLIADGVYTGPGNRDLDCGGKAITVRSAADNPALCVIDCERLGRGFMFHCQESASSVVRGLTIRNGNAEDGGGVYCEEASPTLINCIISGNVASFGGGGVACYTADPTLINCRIIGNTAGDGGGLRCRQASPTLTNCTIIGNVGYYGGGMWCDTSDARLTNCTFTLNSTECWWGPGGALFCEGASTPTLTNCILWADTPGEIYVWSGDDPVATYCDIQGGWPGVGNIDLDPNFASCPSDTHFWGESPCIDSGTDDPPGGLPGEDIEGQPRALDGDGDGEARVDMGAYEFNAAAPTIALSSTQMTFLVSQGQSQWQAMNILNSGAGILAWQLDWQAEWLSVYPTAGESSGETDGISLVVTTGSLARGRYDAVLWVTDPQASNSPRTVAVILYVNGTLHVPGDYATIQAAMDAASPGDEVVIADGVYTGPGNRELNFRGKAIAVRSASNEPGACIIDCEHLGVGFSFTSSETASSVVQGLTIRNATGIPGGAVYCLRASPTLVNCAMIGGTGYYGGGLSCLDSSPMVIDCSISGNLAYTWYGGGGIFCDGCNLTLVNCTISGNTSTRGGGGFYGSGSDLVLINCTLIGNTAVYDGGGGYLDYGSSLTMTNCTVAGNRAGGYGGALSCPCEATFTNCIFWGDVPDEIRIYSTVPTVSFCDVQGGWAGTGNIDVDPGFALPDDFHLMPGSPCIDSGTNDPPDVPDGDIEGQSRPMDGDGDGQAVADIGAYEFNPVAPAIALSAAELTFFVPAGQSASQTLSILNSGSGVLVWQLDWSVDWLSADHVSGESSGEVDLIDLTVDTQGLSQGQHYATLWVVDPQASNSPRAVSIALGVNGEVHVPDEYATIQAGIDAALPGDEVVVADGVYMGPGNRSLDFRGKAIIVRSASGEPATCIVDCEHQGCGLYFHTGETAAAIARGLTICGASASYPGGGINCLYSSPTIADCIIRDNDGSGVQAGASNATLYNCVISGNTNAQGGGGVDCTSSDLTLTNCVISNNAATEYGGAVFCEYSTPIVTNCTIFGNTAGDQGGGLYCGYSSAPVLTNCILWADVPEEIYVHSGSPNVSYCDVQGGWEGAGNINVDPSFAFPSDSHLLPGSACIEAGTSDAPGGLPAEDIEGQPRLIDGDADGQALCDMGAHEFNPAAPAIALSARQVVFAVREGQSAAESLAIRNSGGGTLMWHLDWEADWLTIEPVAGESSGEIDALALTVDTQGLSRGVYDAVVWVTDPQASNSPRPVPIVLYVSGTLYVPAEYATIQAALDAAIRGDEVVLADGVYCGPGNRDLDLHGKPITLRSAGGDPDACIIDCGHQGRGFYFHSGESAASVVQSLTIRNGADRYSGGGMYCVRSSPTLRDCVIAGNSVTEGDGGGVYFYYASASVIGCTISGNTALSGGGLCCYSSNPTLTDCTMSGNTADDGVGGGVYCDNSNPIIIGSVISNNAARGAGGVYCRYSNPTLAGCTVAENTADVAGGLSCEDSNAILTDCEIIRNSAQDGSGGGVYCTYSTVTLTDCAIADNTSGGDGGGIYGWISADATLTGCTIANNAAAGFGGAVSGVSFPTPLSNCVIAANTAGEDGGGLDCIPCSGPALIDCTISGNSAGRDGGGVNGCVQFSPTLTNCTISGNSAGRDGGGVNGSQQFSPTLINCTISCNSAVRCGGGVNGSAHFSGRLTNCVICGNLAQGDGGGLGGFASCQATLEGCVISNNTAEGDGGGVYCSSGGTLTNCSISGNTAGHDGGGVSGFPCNAALLKCTITSNAAGNRGGGLCCSSSMATNCAISGNAAGAYGGGVYLLAYNPSFVNCEISSNTALCGGAFFSFSSAAVLTNCTIAGNTAGDYGGALYCYHSPSPALTNCVVWADLPDEIFLDESDGPAVTYSDVRGAWEGVGNIDADPLFADPDGPDDDPATWADNNYQLTAESPCIDAGQPVCPLPGALDLEGRLRAWDGDGDGLAGMDMGAHEFGSHAYGDVNCDGLINVFDIDPFVRALTDAPAYAAAYPECDLRTADVNADGVVNAFDIDGFVLVLVGG